MKLSRKGALALMAEEGMVLSTYVGKDRVPTIGVGHTAAAGGLVPKPGLKITEQEAVDLFRIDVMKFEDRVSHAIKVPLKQHEFDALVSFDFNTGAIDAGTVDDKLNRNDRAAAIATLKAYTKSDGKHLESLKNRRDREAAMFEKAEYFDRAIPVQDVYFGKARAFDPSRLVWDHDPAPPLPTPPLPPDYEPLPEGNGKAFGVALAGLLALIAGGALYLVKWFTEFVGAMP